MSGHKKWYENRDNLAGYLRFLADEHGLNVRELIGVVRCPEDYDQDYEQFDLQREMRRQESEAADIRRKQESQHVDDGARGGIGRHESRLGGKPAVIP